jgi:DivIVA domain-containing protein
MGSARAVRRGRCVTEKGNRALHEEEIARIRSAEFSSAIEATPSFALSRRGYDKNQVDRFLADLADRLEQASDERVAPPASGSESVRRELELISQKMGELLAQAEESAERIRSEATQEASRVLVRAQGEAEEIKRTAQDAVQASAAESERVTLEANAYVDRVRAEADADAQALRGQAASELAEATERSQVEARQAEEQQRRQLSSELAELAARRDAAREELRKIAGLLSDAVASPEVTSEPATVEQPEPGQDPASTQPLRAV